MALIWPIDKARAGWRLALRSRYGKRARKTIRQRRMAQVRARRGDARYKDKDARQEFFLYQAGLYTPLLGVESDLGLVCVSPYDYGQGRRIFVNRRIGYGPLTRAIELARAAGHDPTGEGKVFLDVGANLGIVTLTALKRFGFHKAVSIEAEPDNYRLLQVNVNMNRGDAEVTTFNVAVSSEAGQALLQRNPGSHGEHALVAEDAGVDDADLVEVPTRPLDSILAESGHAPEDVGFLKIDTEGHEPHVFAGATGILAAGPPTMIEYAPFRYTDSDYGPERLEQIAAEHYTHFFDLRRGGSEETDLRPISELPELRRQYSTGAKPNITDLLLIRR